MTITKQKVAETIASYLRHDISIAGFVSWAEGAMMDGEIDENEVAAISDVVSRLGEDCEQLLRQLGYTDRVDIVAA
jgi:hypothetical protein